MRKRLLFLNTFTSILYQLVVIICGFILPKFILESFGSEVNGLVNSITQFLSIVALMEFGIGAVVSSNLYKPLAYKKWDEVSKILASANNFFKKLAKILFVYVIILVLIFPHINSNSFDNIFTSSLILIISINSFAQYYIGIVDTILLTADQRAYIQYISQAISHLTNTLFCIIFIKLGAGIHLVKLTTASIYLIRPILVRMYINKHYNINRKIKSKFEPIKQKWNAFAQHISECILDSTDIIVLSIFSTLTNVSIYSVYNLVVFNLKQFFLISTNGILSLEGNLWANNEKDKLNKFFYISEWLIHTAIVFIFGCTLILLVPFVFVYTNGINDAVYVQPLFSILIVLAHASHCFRLPYFTLVRAVGHYKETQNSFIIATIMNIVFSCVLVKMYGLIGVAIGTLLAMLFQTIWLSIYCYKKILDKQFIHLIKQFIVDFIGIILALFISCFAKLSAVNYFTWFILAIRVALFYGLSLLLLNMVFYKNNLVAIFNKLKAKVK